MKNGKTGSDSAGCWLQISSGDGPEECCLAVRRFLEVIMGEAGEAGLAVSALDLVPSRMKEALKSALLSVQGEGAEAFCRAAQGVIKWIHESPYRPHHKRKNWFIGVEYFAPVEDGKIDLYEVTFQAVRASGPGGQHVNKSSTAVRATHTPSGLSVLAGEERSQMMNRKLALARLYRMLEDENTEAVSAAEKERWLTHKQLERGNPVRVYQGPDFKRKK